MKKALAFAFLFGLANLVHSVAIVVPIAAAKVATASGSISAVSAMANLTGIAIASFLFSSGGKALKVAMPFGDPVIPGTAYTSTTTDPLNVPQGTSCSRYRITVYGVNAAGQTCPTVTALVAGPSSTVCTTDPPNSFSSSQSCSTGSNPPTATVPFTYHSYITAPGLSTIRVRDDFSYTYKGSTVDPDNAVMVAHSPSGYALPDDPDLQAGVGGASGTPAFTSSGSIYTQGMDSNNLLTVTKITPSENGVSIQEYSQIADNQVRQTNAQIGTNGVVQSTNQNYYQGEVQNIPASSTPYVPDFNPVANPTQNPAPDGSSNPGTGGSVNVQFPSDYARAGEASMAAQLVVDAITQGDLLTPEVADTDMPWFGATFDGVLPTINTSGASCPVWQFDALGESFYIDHHCQLIVDFNALFYAIFTAFWTLLAFRTVLEA